MIVKSVAIGSLFLAGTLVVADTTTAEAIPILTPGAACSALNGLQEVDIQNFSNAVANANAAARVVVCALPRNAGTPTQFQVSGVNVAGTTTTCTLVLYNAAGGLVSTVAFASIVGAWTATINFASPPVVGNEFATLVCTLPGGQAGVLTGTISFP